MPRPRELPDRARIVIIGGGVGGCAIAHHLAKLGERDVVLVDRDELTSGSTFHSAGLVGQLRGSVSLTRLMMDSVELYRTLDCGWVECGGIRLACTPEREQEIHRQVAWARTFGLPLELISADEAQGEVPADGHRRRARRLVPADRRLPRSLAADLRAGRRRPRRRRADLHAHAGARDRGRANGRVARGVDTEWGRIECEVVVNAGGMYAAEIGRLAGVRVPIVPFAHEYLVTQPFYERTHHLPTLRDPDNLVYYREEGEGLVMGGYERNSAPWSLDEHLVDRIPPDFNGRLLEEDWPRFEEIANASKVRVPAMEDVKVTRLINGPEAFTPDNEFCLGESEVRGFFVAAGFCAHGLAGAGGIGKLMAEWITEGEPSIDAWEMDIRRFGAALPLAVVHAQARQGGLRDLLRHPLPGRGAPGRPPAARLAAPTPGTATTARSSARSPAGSASTGMRRTVQSNATEGTVPSVAAAGVGREELVAGDRRRARAPAASARRCSTSRRSRRSRSPGRARREFLEGLCDNRVARDVGAITYTQMLNRRGGIECDFTVTRVEEELFSIVTGTAFGTHDLAWLRRHMPGDGSRARQRRHRALVVLRALGPARARHPRPAHARPARLPLHAHARHRRRRRAGARAARDVRRRARLGAVLPGRVRRRAVAGAVGGGRAARDGRRRLPRDRHAAAGEGLPRLGARTSRRTSRRSRRGWASASSATRSSSAARRWTRRRAERLRCLVAGRPALDRAGQRAGADRRRRCAVASPRADMATRWAARSPTRGCHRAWRWAPPARSTSSASGCAARSPPNRFSTRPVNACEIEVLRPHGRSRWRASRHRNQARAGCVRIRATAIACSTWSSASTACAGPRSAS